jgi:hypothetical protein
MTSSTERIGFVVALLDDPQFLSRRPPPSPLRARKNRNVRHVCPINWQINGQTISHPVHIRKAVRTGTHRRLTIQTVLFVQQGAEKWSDAAANR